MTSYPVFMNADSTKDFSLTHLKSLLYCGVVLAVQTHRGINFKFQGVCSEVDLKSVLHPNALIFNEGNVTSPENN